MSTISLCMIVKNEQDVLARCLSSVKEAAEEIIIVDTGSSDATKEIARQFTSKVYDYVWDDDFAAARNFSFSKATQEYCMWLDADDILTKEDLKKLLDLKATLNPSIHLVMMKYNIAFDAIGKPIFSYYRERLMRRSRRYLWEGAVHEVITPSGNIIYSDIAVTHAKCKPGDPDRNLRIYERLISEGKELNPREQFYFARELFTHLRDDEAIDMYQKFLNGGQGWVENNINACSDLAACYKRKGDISHALRTLFCSFEYDLPRAEVCCAIGQIFLETGRLTNAVFWYELALTKQPDETSGGFIQPDCYGYLPAIQLCVCHDRLGNREKAIEYNEMAAKFKPGDPATEYNRKYFGETKPE